MGIPENTFSDIIGKVKSWIRWGGVSDNCQEHWVSDDLRSMCCECKSELVDGKMECHSCGRVLCPKCMQGIPIVEPVRRRGIEEGDQILKICKYCELNRRVDHPSYAKLMNDNVKSFQSDHLLRFLEANRAVANGSVASSTDNISPVSFLESSSRSDDEDGDDSGKHFFSPSSEYYRDISDIDSRRINARHENFSVKSVGSSPYDSPSRMTSTPRSGSSIQQEPDGSPLSLNDAHPHQGGITNFKRSEMESDDIENTDYGSDDLSTFRDQYPEVKQPLKFENNGLIWLPPPPEDEEDEMESNFFEDDEDEDMENSGMLSACDLSTDIFSTKGRTNDETKEPLRVVVHGHFRALVLQLLQGEDIYVENEDDSECWLNIVTSLAFQAANFVKPDTRKGGSMDPGDYVKVKCIEAGSPSESTLIKGVVCTKNIKHKRMTSQYKNPRLFLLGGALEYQKTPNKLASFDALLQQEIDQLKVIVSKIEAHRPNVLLVEKSVSSYAQEYLLAKDISLVLNVKRPLLERIARCTGAHIVPSIDNLSSARLGSCEVFRLERVVEDCFVSNQPNKKVVKTLMFFEGCPRRLGCTVLLRGAHSELLKKIKRVIQYAVFAAYHLSLETSFLSDEGATLLNMPLKASDAISGRLKNTNGDISLMSSASFQGDFLSVEDHSEGELEFSMSVTRSFDAISDVSIRTDRAVSFITSGYPESSCSHYNSECVGSMHTGFLDSRDGNDFLQASNRDLVPDVARGIIHQQQCKDWESLSRFSSQLDLVESAVCEEEITIRHQSESTDDNDLTKRQRTDANGVTSDYFSVDNHQSILVSFSSHCVLKGTLCERSQLLRIKFYGNFDKPLGRYLQDDLFGQSAYCRSCKESTDAHVRCYTHQQGSLTINVRRLIKAELPGVHDGKIWMWHRCLKCAHIDGVPPANRRVLMSDAAWGLSFGKFLELSFSNHATANRVASCGHSLQRDCLRFYGFGSMVAFFRYSPIDILTVRLPPSMLEVCGVVQHEWVKKEAIKLYNEMEVLYAEVFDALHSIEQKSVSLGQAYLDESGFHDHIKDLKVLLKKERNEYEGLLHPVCTDDPHLWEVTLDNLELNRWRRCLLLDSYIWDHRLYSLESLSRHKPLTRIIDPHILEAGTYDKLKKWRDDLFYQDVKLNCASVENKKPFTVSENPKINLLSECKEEHQLSLVDSVSTEVSAVGLITKSVESYCLSSMEFFSDPEDKQYECDVDSEVPVDESSESLSLPSPASCLSEKIDSAWSGTGQQPERAQVSSQVETKQTRLVGLIYPIDNPSFKMLKAPMRVQSFDSAMRFQEKISRGLSPSSQITSLRSFHASGEYASMVRDPIPHILRTLSHTPSRESQKLSSIFNSTPLYISSASNLGGEGVRLLLPQTGSKKIVLPVYDKEPTSVVSYALCSKEYEDWIADKAVEHETSREDEIKNISRYHSAASAFSALQSLSSLDFDDVSIPNSSMFAEPRKSPHFRTSFEDEYSSSSVGKVKFSVTCYFASQFDALRKTCLSNDLDFIRSLSRCNRWNAQGGKSNVYFAKSFDDRFIIKQVTKTELDSFEEFAPQYFKYLTESLNSGSPTCLAKVLGIYQVIVHPKGGKQTKMDLMVMENLFFRRSISRVYDLKGSARSRYNADPTGKNKVLLDLNLLETLRTEPLLLGSKAKRSLERAVWNDTSFLASIDVMDYSLLVGVDDKGKELVLGIIDFMRQYTWDKHLETWVKASGILGGPKNAAPTVVSPMQYKKRFRKAMSTYFLTVPDQWTP
ncbi:1-phosphatidylinositol-3-phosphate 5-kinase [Ranunculus cassubicifolius]